MSEIADDFLHEKIIQGYYTVNREKKHQNDFVITPTLSWINLQYSSSDVQLTWIMSLH